MYAASIAAVAESDCLFETNVSVPLENTSLSGMHMVHQEHVACDNQLYEKATTACITQIGRAHV